MKLQEILIFGSLIVIVGILFYTSGGNLSNLDELPSEFDGKNVVYPAGDTFVLTFNAEKYGGIWYISPIKCFKVSFIYKLE